MKSLVKNKIKVGGINTCVYNYSSFNKSNATILYLHGFTGCAGDWNELSTIIDKKFNQVGIDLIGHGKTDSPKDITFYTTENIIRQIYQAIKCLKLNEVILAGYSMGGRAAMNFAVNYPNKIRGLILESTTAGIESQKFRKERIILDEELADYIESHNIEEFAELWMSKEIFHTQRNFSNEKLKSIWKKKILNSKVGLANSLRGFGTGRMEYLGNELKKIDCPVLLITGELDKKFTKINSALQNKFPNAKHKIIINSGHNTHLEEPGKFIIAANEFLKKF